MYGLFEAIKLATAVGKIDWKRTTDEAIEGRQGYTGMYKDFMLTTIVRKKKRNIVFGLRIVQQDKVLTLTSDPKVLTGQKEDYYQLLGLFWDIQNETQKRDLDYLLRRALLSEFQ